MGQDLSHISCGACAVCCVAPDISTLNKPAGIPCEHLTPDLRCRIYENRPAVCRDYQMDETCLLIQAPTMENRVAQYQVLFDIDP
jgi:Fe-S-cluster containining protein